MGFRSPTPHPWVSQSSVSRDGGSQHRLPVVLGQVGTEEAEWRAGRSESEADDVNVIG